MYSRVGLGLITFVTFVKGVVKQGKGRGYCRESQEGNIITVKRILNKGVPFLSLLPTLFCLPCFSISQELQILGVRYGI